ncbi:MAG: ATP-dependent 6-phosphofructokinase [Thermoguttaceae bacterium]
MRIGVLCSGGDAPGMNPCLRAIVRTAQTFKDEVIGIRHGYQGIYDGDFYQHYGKMFTKSPTTGQVNPFDPDKLISMGSRSVSGLSMRGGTVLHSSRCRRFTEPDGVREAAEILTRLKIDALIPIGGNGTMTGALDLSRCWSGQIIGIPGTIDNDLMGTDATIGFATAVQTATDAVDKLRDTAGSHDMMFLIEVMGRHCGDIALYTAIASGAEIVCIPEVKSSPEKLVKHLHHIKKLGKMSVLLIVAEGDESGGAVKLQEMLKQAGNPYDSRVVVLGHTQRGGIPAPADRILASELGCGAVKALHEGKTGQMIGIIKNHLRLSPLEEVIQEHRKISPEMLSLLHIVAG